MNAKEDIGGKTNYQFNYPLALIITHPYCYIKDKDKLKSLNISDERFQMLETDKEYLSKEECDVITDLLSPGSFEMRAKKFFCDINDPTKAEYWSSQKIEYDKKINKEINEYLNKESTTFTDVIEFAIKRALKYLSCNPENSPWTTDEYSLHGTSGNSKWSQFDCYLGNFGDIAVQKLYKKYDIPPNGFYERDLGFGHVAKRYIDDQYLHIGTKRDKFYIEYKPKVKGDYTFHDELIDNLSKVKDEIRNYYSHARWFKKSISELLKEINNERSL